MQSGVRWEPTVSVIIPAKNEEKTIKETLDSIRRVNYPTELLELIVVDNGSDDATAEIARQAGAWVIEHPGVLVGAVRNRGAQLGAGSVLVFFDADVIVQPGFLRGAIEMLCDENVGAVGGIYTVTKNASWVERAWVVERTREAFETDCLPGGSFAVKRSVFEQSGKFSETLAAGEDDELSRRIAKLGYRVMSIQVCDVEHLGYPSTLSGIFRRQVWHGSSQLESAESYRDPILLLTHGFTVGLAGTPVTLYLSQSLMAMFGLLSLMGLLCVIAAIFKEKRARQFRFVRIVQRSVLFWVFFFGRSVGLIKNYQSRMVRALKPQTAGKRYGW